MCIHSYHTNNIIVLFANYSTFKIKMDKFHSEDFWRWFTGYLVNKIQKMTFNHSSKLLLNKVHFYFGHSHIHIYSN